MKRVKKRSHLRIGAPPGTLVYIGDKKVEKVKIAIITYNEDTFSFNSIYSINEIKNFLDNNLVKWINIEGLEPTVLEEFGKLFDIHPLTLEDILNTDQRPKIDILKNYIYIVLNKLFYNDATKSIDKEQISLIIKNGIIFTFQEENKCLDVLDILISRLKNNLGIIRKMGIDYLAYSIIDIIVDNYFLILEKIEDKIDSIEELLFSQQTSLDIIQKINNIKKDTISLSRFIWPLRDIINNLLRRETTLITEATLFYLRDLYDNITYLLDTIENFKERLSELLELYHSSVNNKLNQVIKTLTIISTIFIPLNFIASIYGMNFNPDASPLNMPELNWYYGYPTIITIMILVALIMLIYFRKNKWI